MEYAYRLGSRFWFVDTHPSKTRNSGLCRHYTLYNDSHGSTSCVDNADTYNTRLESQGAFYAKWDSLLQKLLCVTPENLLQLESDETRVNVWQAAFDERMESGTPTYYPRYTDMNIEYTYTIDLDLQVFSTDNSAHYRLNHIPRNQEWIGAMFQDGAGHRFVLPQYVPKESVASLTVEVEDFSPNASDYWKELKTREVKPKTFTSTSSKIRLKLFNIFQKISAR